MLGTSNLVRLAPSGKPVDWTKLFQATGAGVLREVLTAGASVNYVGGTGRQSVLAAPLTMDIPEDEAEGSTYLQWINLQANASGFDESTLQMTGVNSNDPASGTVLMNKAQLTASQGDVEGFLPVSMCSLSASDADDLPFIEFGIVTLDMTVTSISSLTVIGGEILVARFFGPKEIVNP